jgi:lipopolysaccharide transport system permease protein
MVRIYDESKIKVMTTTAIETKKKIDVVTIRPSKGWVGLHLRDIWLYRELVYFLTWRDLKVRYKQSVLGVLWAILKPFLSMVVFSVLFGKLAKLPSDGIPYPLFYFVGNLPWDLFSTSLSVASKSMVTSSNMVSKIYFPRLIIPLSSVMASVVDFLISFVILIGLMIFYKYAPTIGVLWLPVLILLALVTALGVGFWTSALMVRYRDFNYILPFVTQLWLFITPVLYSAKVIPQKWLWLYSLNPMTGVIESFRHCLLGTDFSISPLLMVISILISILMFISGLFYFRRMEREFADMI